MSAVLVVVAAFVGAVLQRVTGVGFALVVSPFLVLLLGPVEGVIVVNVCGALTTGVILARTFRDVEWRRYLLLAPPALGGVAIGTVVVHVVPAPVLDLAIGLLVLAALATIVLFRGGALPPRWGYGVAAGAVSGIMNTTAGLGGPAVTVYALASRWEPASFRSTMQAFFFTIGVAALATKLLTGVATVPALDAVLWLAVGAACLAGLVGGALLARVVSGDALRVVLVIISAIGAVATIVRGVVGLAA